MRVSERIAAEIAGRGPVSFARFMELALYDPGDGYYAAGKARIGREGDFYTNVSVGPVFGWLLARQFEEMWERLGRPEPFFLIEQGAHDGRLAADILSVVAGPFARAVRFAIVEPSRPGRERQEQTLAECAFPVRWVGDIAELGPFTGAVFGNELLDAFPFHLLRSTGHGWRELFVAGESGSFTFVESEISAEAQAEAVHLLRRAEGVLAEVRPAAAVWLRNIAARMRRGFVLVADYGEESEILFAPEKSAGTFACYRNHRRDELPLEDPGSKDITAHVDFAAVLRAGEKNGFVSAGYSDQYHFIVALADPLLRSADGRGGAKPLRQLKTLLHPQIMGRAFKFLCLAKNCSLGEPLIGFRHGKTPIS